MRTARASAGLALLAVLLVAAVELPSRAQEPADLSALGTCSDLDLPFSASGPPPACWRPYGSSSPFNQRIPPGARTLPGSAAIVDRLAGFGRPQNLVAGYADTPDDWEDPVYWSSPADPEFTLHCTEPWGRCAVEGMKLRIPDRARAAAGGDAHMTVVDPSSGWEYDMYGVTTKPSGGGRLDFRWGGRTRIDGDGLGSDATASRFGNLAGIIRAPELASGRIDHALVLTALCDSGSWVYPAKKNGRPCSAIGRSNTDAPPMGARFQLMMSDAEIDALPVPEYRKVILRAAAHYGMYFGDTGSSSWALQLESGTSYTSFGLPDAVVTAAKAAGASAGRNGQWVLDLKSGVDWASRLRVVDPCSTQRTCPDDDPVATPAPTTTPSATATPAPTADATPSATATATPATTTRTPATATPTAVATESAAPSSPAPQTPPPATAAAVPVAVDVTRRQASIVAKGTVPPGTSGPVRLTAYMASSARGRYRRVSERRSPIRGGRFQARMARYRRGSWRIIAQVRGAPTASTRAGLSGGDAATPGRVTASQGAFGSSVRPGPLASGDLIRVGDVGRAVQFVKVLLKTAGIDVGDSRRFDAATARAVRRFQRERALQVDGIVGRQTLAALQTYRMTPR